MTSAHSSVSSTRAFPILILSSPSTLFVALLVRLPLAFLSHVLTDKSAEQTDVLKQGKVVNLSRSLQGATCSNL